MTETYPGQHTEFFIVSGGVPVGPIVGLVEVFKHNIGPDTPVWYDGLDDWSPALMADLTRQLFTPGSPFYKTHPEALQIMQGRMTGADPDTLPTLVDDPEVPAPANPITPTAPVTPTTPAAPQPRKPATYLVLAIIATILCCLPTGIVASIYSSRVSTLYFRGEYEKACKASEAAQWWIAVTIVVGLVAAVASVFWSF